MFSKILIANRGEIAVRVIQACRELDLRRGRIYAGHQHRNAVVSLCDECRG